MIPAFRMRDSFLHRRHPASAILLVAALVAVALIADNPFFQVTVIIATAILARSAGVLKEWFGWWKICLIVGLATAIINPLVSREGATIIWNGPTLPVLGHLRISWEAVAFGAGMGLRLAAIIWVFALLTLTVDPDSVLGLLRGRGSKSALVTALTLRMVPTTVRDAGDLMDAQRSRGVVVDSGSKWALLKSRLPLMKRVLSTSLDRGIGLAEAMEARAYGSGRRSRYREYHFAVGDMVTVVVAVMLLGAVIAGAASGILSFKYYPSISISYGPGTLALLLSPLVLAALLALLSWGWRRSDYLRLRT